MEKEEEPADADSLPLLRGEALQRSSFESPTTSGRRDSSDTPRFAGLFALNVGSSSPGEGERESVRVPPAPFYSPLRQATAQPVELRRRRTSRAATGDWEGT